MEEVAEGYPARFLPGGPVVLELGGDLQVLRVGEGVLEGGLVHLVVYYWGRGWSVLLVRDFGGVGFLGCFCLCEGPVVEVFECFLHGLGFDDVAEFVQEGFQARELARPETVGARLCISGEELLPGGDVLDEIGSVLEAEHEGGDEVHGDGMVQLEDFDRSLFDGSGLQKWQETGKD